MRNRTGFQKKGPIRVLAALLLPLAAACGSEAPPGTGPAGGGTTVVNRTSAAFKQPAPNLTDQDLVLHAKGDLAFEATFVTAGGPVNLNPGLGPLFNHNGCASCHVNDGRGLPVASRGPIGSPLLLRVSLATGTPEVPGGPVPVPGLGTQIQDHAIVGAVPEATVAVAWDDLAGSYGDGTPYTLRRPDIDVTLAGGSPLPAEVLVSPRVPPPVFGLGLLEAVPEPDLIRLEDPLDLDGDGISGRRNLVWDAAAGRTVTGRFGWKANQPDLFQQAAGAYLGDVGVTTPLFPESDGSFEVDLDTLNAATFYTQTLAVPARADPDDPEVRAGEALFGAIGCAGCHRPTLHTGDHPVAALVDQTFHPYTDLLLHDMGDGLADGRPDFLASGREWRTAPLWGLGLVRTVLGDAAFLHDGRARTPAEAILWHGGEAEAAREAFRSMGAADRARLLAFLASL